MCIYVRQPQISAGSLRIVHFYHQLYTFITNCTLLSPIVHFFNQLYTFITNCTLLSPIVHFFNQLYTFITNSIKLLSKTVKPEM